MKKWLMFFFCALLALLPPAASAESLPEVLGAVSQGLSEGLQEARETLLLSGQDLSLTLTAPQSRIEEGETLLLTLTAENPYPAAADVTLTLNLPERLSCTQESSWQAQLEGASVHPETGETVPSVTVFTREVTLIPGSGAGEQAELTVEMGMGARFYRAKAPLELCVPLISAGASIEGTQDGLIKPGEPFTLIIDVVNEGTAAKDVPFTLDLPADVFPGGELPEGFSLKERTITGSLRAEAGESTGIHIPLTTRETLLDGDEDASRLIAPVLTVDGKRISAPMLRVVSAMISATLTPELTSLEEGGMMNLAITVVNSGLADADVELSCLLPAGLSVLAASTKNPGDPPAPDAQAVADGDGAPMERAEDGALVYAVHMDAAKETEAGIAAATKELLLRVRADVPLEEARERLLGATLAWRTNAGDTKLSEPAVLRVYPSGFMGLARAEWNGILLAALLMLVTVCCLCSAVRSDKQDDYCFE